MAQVAVGSQINTKHINTVWAEHTVVEFKLVVHHVTGRLYKLKLHRSVRNTKVSSLKLNTALCMISDFRP